MGFVLQWIFWSLVVEAYSTQDFPRIEFMENILPNHSYIDLSEVGLTQSSSVHCHTDLVTCCSSSEGQHRGDWYPPDSETRLPFSDPSRHIFEQRSDREVEIRRRDIDGVSAVSGIYTVKNKV